MAVDKNGPLLWDKLYAFEGLRKLTKFHGLEEKEMSTKKEVIEALIKGGTALPDEGDLKSAPRT